MDIPGCHAKLFSMMRCLPVFEGLLMALIASSLSADPIVEPPLVSTISRDELRDFQLLNAQEKALIEAALELTRQNLTYLAASHDPAKGGMDCSGAIYHLLHTQEFKQAPRQSNQMGRWVRDHSLLHHAGKARHLEDPSLSHLRPGDLMFWVGTYDTQGREDLPITHVMLFLGWRMSDGKPVIFGSSDGRSYEGQRRRGVSVFDFVLPRAEAKAQFLGYGRIPGLPEAQPPPEPAAEPVAAPQEEVRKAVPKGG
jgi:hypothetical protein